MASLTQSHLTASPQGQLCSCIKRPPPSPRYRGPCVINQLPTELLTKILLDAARHKRTRALPLVCKHWQLASQSALYETLSLNNEQNNPVWHYHRLHQAILNTPRLGGYVRTLDLLLWDPSPETCQFFADIVQLCSGLKSLSVYTIGSTDHLLPILKAGGQLSRLERLFVGDRAFERGGVPLKTILTSFRRSPLKSIRLSRYGLGNEKTLLDYEWRRSPGTVSRTVAADLSAMVAQANPLLETLELIKPCAPAVVTEILLRWPKGLVNLSFSGLCRTRYNYSLNELQSILNIQRHSLQSIRIGVYSSTPSGIADFSQFPHLRKLYLSMYNLLTEDPSIAAAKLTTSQLTQLYLSFDTEEQLHASLAAFGSVEADWMERFIAHKGRDEALDGLKMIEIEYGPDAPDSWESIPWPYEYMKSVQETFRRAEVSMLYTTLWTRDNWTELLATNKRRDEEINLKGRWIDLQLWAAT